MSLRRLFLFSLAGLLFSTCVAAQQAPQLARDYVYGPGGRLALTVEPDYYPPGPPSSFSASQAGLCAENGVNVSWWEATDIGSGVAFYRVYRDGNWLADVSGFSYLDLDVQPEINYTYWATAVDRAGHEGEASQSSSVFIPLCWFGFLLRPPSQPAVIPNFSHVRLLNIPAGETHFAERAFPRIRLLPFTLVLEAGYGGGGGQ